MARPRVHVNWAQSLDGRIAGPGGMPLRLSDDQDLARVHGLRAEYDAILVGIGTVLTDDPSLRVKPSGPDPLRVVLDRQGRTPPTARVVDGTARTVVFVGGAAGDVAGRWPDADVLRVPDGSGGLDLHAVLDALGERGTTSLLVEGGGQVLRSFLAAGLADVITCYVAPRFVGDAPGAWPGEGGLGLVVERAEPVGEGLLVTLGVPAPAGVA